MGRGAPKRPRRFPPHVHDLEPNDGLDTIELLLDANCLVIHPRCVRLKEAFGSYCKQRHRGQWIDYPADGHPGEDLMDALRGGIRDAMPEGAVITPGLPRIRASRVR